MKRNTLLIFPALLIAGSLCPAGQKCAPRLQAALSNGLADGRYLVWITFSDKGIHELTKSSIPLDVVSSASLHRRMNVLPPESLVDYTDLPLDPSYVIRVADLGVQIRQSSKWFNAVSGYVTTSQLATLENLPYVRSIDLVNRFTKSRQPETVGSDSPQLHLPPSRHVQKVADLDYGLSYDQVNLINVPALHALGNHGEGVIIGMFDNGVRLLSHETFDTLRPRIIATHDFVDHKVSVAPNDPDLDFGDHGVWTLSTIGGYTPGELIGPAYGASFLLARTENDSSETPIEEDNWVAGIEWADSLGVQVTSTSLGYLTFDAPYTSLTWQDMDGRTAIISRAATMAAEKGIVVCNSAGNEYHGVQRNTLIAPADADSILTVGAVDPQGILAPFSSRGPTIDGRIKPDVVAQGTSVRVASSAVPTAFGYEAGTSFSCPLTAGVAALLVKAYPHATPMEIINALRNSASNAGSPDNFYGWGIIDALGAYEALRPGSPDETTYSLLQNFPNPFNPATHIEFNLPEEATVSLKVYDILGRDIATIVDDDRPARHYIETWTGVTRGGVKAASGVYFYVLQTNNPSGQTHRLVGKMMLLK